MAHLVVLGLILSASHAASRSAEIEVTDGRLGVGVITGGQFGPGSFSIGAPGGTVNDSFIPHIGPTDSKKVSNVNEEIVNGQKGKRGEGGTGGGQIVIGSVSIPNSRRRNNGKSRRNKKHNKNKDCCIEDSSENDIFSKENLDNDNEINESQKQSNNFVTSVPNTANEGATLPKTDPYLTNKAPALLPEVPATQNVPVTQNVPATQNVPTYAQENSDTQANKGDESRWVWT